MSGKIRYNKSQFASLQKSLGYIKPLLEKRRDFIQHYAEIYKFKSSHVKKKVKLYSKLLQAVALLQDLEYCSNGDVSQKKPISPAIQTKAGKKKISSTVVTGI